MTRLPDPETQPQFYDGVPGKRLLAWLIDTALIFLISVIIVPLTGFIAAFFLPLLLLVVHFVYRVITLANGSATWGMKLMAIEFRDADDQRLDLGQAAAHTAGHTLSIVIPVIQLISVVLMATTQRGQSLTDMMLNTTALNNRRGS